MEKQWKISDVAKFYGISNQAVYKWVNEGKIKTTTTPGGEKRIPESELMRFTEAK